MVIPFAGVVVRSDVVVPDSIKSLLFRSLIATASYYARSNREIRSPLGFVNQFLRSRIAAFERGGASWTETRAKTIASLNNSVRYSTDALAYAVFDLANVLARGQTFDAQGRVGIDYRDEMTRDNLVAGQRALCWLVGHALGHHEAGQCVVCDLERVHDWSVIFAKADMDGALVRMVFAQMQKAGVAAPIAGHHTLGAVMALKDGYVLF